MLRSYRISATYGRSIPWSWEEGTGNGEQWGVLLLARPLITSSSPHW
ncbi:hypothetical protein CKA32_003837 [Geitlerinema sp. FC II]|nr:hypothetical protein CKA32_003837 [Geitlerinema sp. FC II]